MSSLLRRALVPASVAAAFMMLGVAACFPGFSVTGSDDGGSGSGGGSGGGSSSGGSGGGSGSGSTGSGGASGGGGSGSGGGGSGGGSGSGSSSGGVVLDDGGTATEPDGAPITGDGGSAPYDAATQVLVPHGSFNFTDYSGAVTVPASFTNDVLWDKTEVTTAAFDAWITAGMTMPNDWQSLDPGGPYASQMYWQGNGTWSTYAADLAYKDTSGDACDEVRALAGNDDTQSAFNYTPTYTQYLAAGKSAATGVYPVTCVNYYQAVAFCWWNGHKRLPTEAEWQYEITGRGRSYTYPWGNSPDPSDCTLAIWRDNGTATDNYNGCNFPKAVGSAPKGASFDGVLDMQGSVEEWIWNSATNDFSIAWPPNFAGPPEDGGVDMSRTARSGSFFTPNDNSPTKNLDGRAYDNFGTPSTTVYADLGFRCVKSRL